MANVTFCYPTWKKVVWRFVRVFVASFIATATPFLINAKPEDLESVEKFLNVLIFPACIAGVAGGISAIGKLARELFGDSFKVGVIDKLPI